jgi:hypothetical protein
VAKGQKEDDTKPTGAKVAGMERRVELVEPAPENQGRVSRIGLGLLVSIVIGFDPLRDAALGTGSFPMAMFRYLACLGCSVAGMLALGRLLDGAPPPLGEEPLDAEVEAEE